MSGTHAIVAKITAKPGKGEDLAALLAGSLDLARAEEGTVDWYAMRADENTFFVCDTFAGESARQAHLEGQITQNLMARADELLAGEPEIGLCEVMAQK